MVLYPLRLECCIENALFTCVYVTTNVQQSIFPFLSMKAWQYPSHTFLGATPLNINKEAALLCSTASEQESIKTQIMSKERHA